MICVGQQNGYILLPVVLFITVIATIAFLINNDGTLNADMTAAAIEAEKVQQVAQAGLAHAIWGAQNSGCAGDMGMTAVPFGQAGTDTYTATVTTPGGTTTAYALSADQDAWFRSDNVTVNNGTNATHHLRMESGNLEYAVFRFDLSTLPAGAQINSATALFYVKAGKGHPEGPVNVHRVTADWIETGATWETMGSNFDSAVLNTIPPQPDAGDVWAAVNLTAQVQAWVNGGEPNYGIVLIPTGEGTHGEYISREGVASQRPRLDVIVGNGPASPMAVTVTGTLSGNPSPANDITRTLTRSAVPAYQPPGTVTLQLGTDPGADTLIDSFYPRNYGGADYLQVNADPGWLQRPLLKFDLARIPAHAAVLSARLELSIMSVAAPGTATVHRVARSWVEGSQTGGGTADGATWATYDGTNNWTSAGGDFDASVVDETAIDPADTWVSWEIGPLVERWLAGEPNDGLLIKADGALREAKFAARENTNLGVQPKLTITYACECGSACLAPQGSGKVLMVVGNDVNPDSEDVYKQSLLEAWGYTVQMINDDAAQSDYDAGISNHDVAYVSETTDSTALGSKLGNPPIGIVNEDGWMNDELGIESANSSNWPVGNSIAITDNSHYITALFPTGALTIYDGDMGGLAIGNTPAPDLQPLADWGTDTGLAVLEAGAMTAGGYATAGRRVMLPFGRDIQMDWRHVNNNGLLTLQRALQWGTGIIGGGGLRVLYVVKDPAVLSTQEAARQTMMQGWGFTVTLIDDDDTQANFDVAAAANDAVYISQEMLAGSLGTKLVNTTIGVVNESKDMIDDFGFTTGLSMDGGVPTLNVDPDHYITSVFTTNPVSPYVANEWYQIPDEPVAPGVDPVGTWVEVPWTGKPALMALPRGADLIGGGTAADRRVQIPWGSGQGATPVALDSLSDDARTIIKRSIEWAGGIGCSSLKPLLMVVSDAVSPTSQETARQTLIESWCYKVTLIDDDAASGEFAAAMGLNDVIYISQEITTLTVVTKLKDATIGIVNEEYLIGDDLGLASGYGTGFTTDLNVLDNTHYITSGLSLGVLPIFNASSVYTGAAGTLAPALLVLGQVSSTSTLVALEAGAPLFDSGTAAGRRVQVAWGDDFSALNADGQALMQRAIEWAGTPPPSPAPAYNVLLIVGNLTLSSKDVGYKALMESWGHTVTLIDDGDSQANYDTKMDAADVVYASGSALGANMLNKATNATKGLVNEVSGKIDNFGFSSVTSSTVNMDTFSATDATHYITESFGGNPVTVFTSSLTNPVPGGTLAPDLQNVGEVSGTLSLVTLDTGATRYDGNPSPGRRVHLPFTSAETTEMTADGKIILQRTLEWAAGASGGGGGGGGPSGVAFEEFTEAADNGTSLAINKPTGTVAGDLLVAAVATDGSTAGSLSAPAEWNVVDRTTQGGAVTFGVWWKLAGASESSTTTFSWSGNEHAYGWVMRFTGHDPSSPINAIVNDGGTSSTPSSPAVTTTVDGTLVLRVGGFDDDDITTGDPGLSGHTAINMGHSGGGPATASGGSGYVLQPVAGDSGTSSFNLTNTEEYRAVTIAITPAP